MQEIIVESDADITFRSMSTAMPQTKQVKLSSKRKRSKKSITNTGLQGIKEKLTKGSKGADTNGN